MDIFIDIFQKNILCILHNFIIFNVALKIQNVFTKRLITLVNKILAHERFIVFLTNFSR